MKKLRLFLLSLVGWPLGLTVESVLLTCWPLFLWLWLGLGWRWYAALPALLVGWVGANLIGLAFLRKTLRLPVGMNLTPDEATRLLNAAHRTTGGIRSVMVVFVPSLPGGGEGSPQGFGRIEAVYHFPRWLWLYDNDEDGVGGVWVGRNGNERRWCERAKHWPLWLRVLSWQFRNPIANLRRSAWGVQLDGARIEALGNCRRPDQDFGGVVPAWLWARKGWRVGFWMVRPSRKWRTITHAIGWRVFAFDPALDKPEDQHQPFKVQLWRRG